MMHILIAPNAFKNSLTAMEAAQAISNGLQLSSLKCTTECFPIADGGDGTAELIIKKLNGEHIPVQVDDPLRRLTDASFGLVDNGKTAVIEMADASGLRLLMQNERDPLHATSYGTGQMMKKALDLGVNKIVIAMGGSATVDGGMGILSALGAKFIGADANVLIESPKDLSQLNYVDLTSLDARIADCEIIVLCDVDNKLLGSQGAAAVFGPQKGASREQVLLLDKGLQRLSEITREKLNKDMATVTYGGAAGGASAGVWAYLNAKLVNGIDYFLDMTGFDQSLAHSQLVITGEGSIDEQTLQGKGPYGVAIRAKKAKVPVIGLAGKIPLEPSKKLSEYFNVLLAIGNEPVDISVAIAQTRKNLLRISKQVGELVRLKYFL
jgi:glycerate kinase